MYLRSDSFGYENINYFDLPVSASSELWLDVLYVVALILYFGR